MRLERVGTCVLRDDLSQQPADGIEQHEAIAGRGGRILPLERLGDRGEPRRRDLAED